MKSTLVIITAVIYVVGSVGVPIVAYCCPMTGQSGVTVNVDGSLTACFVDPCCETKPHGATIRLEASDSCCDVTVQHGVTSSQNVLSGFKYGADHPVQAVRIHFDVIPARTLAVTTQSDPVARSPIDSPLLI